MPINVVSSGRPNFLVQIDGSPGYTASFTLHSTHCSIKSRSNWLQSQP